MQAEMDGLQVESKRKESSISIISREKAHMAERLREEEGLLLVIIYRRYLFVLQVR
jgi:hypothetical protein